MLRFPLDNSTGKILTIGLFRNVTNAGEIKRKLIDGSLKCCAITPKLIIDPFQVVVAANKAAVNAVSDKLVTKTIYTEVLFNLSTSKNISQALTKFGLSDTDKELIICTIENNENVKLDEVIQHIEGELCEMDVLAMLSDNVAIKKTYKVTDVESRTFSLVDSVVSRIAASDYS